MDAFAETAAAMDGGVAPALAKLFAAYAAAAPKAPAAADADAERSVVPERARFPDELAAQKLAGDPQGRAALVRALGAAARSLTAKDLPLVSTFLTKVLADEDEAVRRDAAMRGGRAMIELHGAQHVQQLLGVYEGYFDRATRGGGAGDGLTDAQTDNTRQGVAVFLGSLAGHLEKDDPRARRVLARWWTSCPRRPRRCSAPSRTACRPWRRCWTKTSAARWWRACWRRSRTAPGTPSGGGRRSGWPAR